MESKSILHVGDGCLRTPEDILKSESARVL